MATASRTVSNDSRGSSGSSQNGMNATSPRGGGILANAHEAPKKPIKVPDGSFTSALRAAFIPQQAGKQMKANGKPLGKSFERTQPLMTRGHEGGEVLKRDPRGQNAPCGDGVVLTNEFPDEEEKGTPDDEEGTPWSPASVTSDSLAPSSLGSSDSAWEQVTRGRSTTTSNSLTRSTSTASSQNSSNNPCSIKFAPLPSSGRLKRANSITIGVAARSQMLHSQGSGRASNNTNTAAWQAQFNAQRYGGPQPDQNGQLPPQQPSKSVIHGDDTVDLGEEIRKGALKAWRRMRRGSSVSSSSGSANGSPDNVAASDEKSPGRQGSTIESVEEEETHELATGEKTPKRSESPPRMAGLHREDLNEEPEGTRTPRHSMQRRLSTGTFIGNNAFMEIEEKRKRESRGVGDDGDDAEREENAHFAEALGRTHASRVAHHTVDDKWHPGMNSHSDGQGKETSVGVVEADTSGEEDEFELARTGTQEEVEDDEDDEEAKEAERMADEALHAHSAKATKAGAVEKMERKQR